MENPLIIQSDYSVLLDVHSPLAEEARDSIAVFCDLVKSPEHIHTYQINPLSVWNAVAAGKSADYIVDTLGKYAKFPFSRSIELEIRSLAERYGLIRIYKDGKRLLLEIKTRSLAMLVANDDSIRKFLGKRIKPEVFEIPLIHRGNIKRALVQIGYPARDQAGFTAGADLGVSLKKTLPDGEVFQVRDYQRKATLAFDSGHKDGGGHGVIVLPCGAGKTIVGMDAMASIKQNTLILTTGITSLRQWKRELLDKTDLKEDFIAEYSGETKNIAPVTLTTYQILSYRQNRESDVFPHFSLFYDHPWGLIIYDEVHLLPAPVFRITAELQARRRLGLTATLVREDGKEKDVFALIGPKRFDVPWRELERDGFIAQAKCCEIRVSQTKKRELEYALSPNRQRFRFASENPSKVKKLKKLLKEHKSKKILIIGEYLDQLENISRQIQFPLITGKTPQKERERLYENFRGNKIGGLALSRVGNFAVDLPDAEVLIQVSGKYGSRQEEAQRLGRILRPKSHSRAALFYTLISSGTCEEDFARKRQRFLAEQGYEYDIEIA